MRTTLFVLFGLLVALIGGVVAWALAGPVPGIIVAIIALGLAVWGARREPGAARGGVAAARGIRVADAFTPMQGTTSVTTHMTENPPDIHPKAVGFDILAMALVDALD